MDRDPLFKLRCSEMKRAEGSDAWAKHFMAIRLVKRFNAVEISERISRQHRAKAKDAVRENDVCHVFTS
jgi:hypothetical protein